MPSHRRKVQAILTSESSTGPERDRVGKERGLLGHVPCRSSTSSLRDSFRELEGRDAIAHRRKKDAAAAQKIDSGSMRRCKVLSMQASEWVAVEEFLRGSRHLSPTDAWHLGSRHRSQARCSIRGAGEAAYGPSPKGGRWRP